MAPEDRTPGAAREERQWAGAPFDADSLPVTVWEALLVARDRYGGGKIILEDHDRVPLTYDALLAAAGAIAIKLREIIAPGSAVGVMLPTSVGGATLFLALQAAALTPTMLNYAAGADKVRAACALAGVRHVLSSRRFVEEGHYQSLIETLAPDFAVIWAEDLRDSVGPLDLLRIGAALRERRPASPPSSNAPATILFTSGTTGAPKGVVLSHRNIIANLEQCRRHGFFDPDWVFFNSLPLFHAFGLVAGTLLPLINGSKAVLYPSPLRYAQIVQLVEATKPSVLVSTDTFARQYARAATHRELASLKYLVLGAEPLRAETLALWRQVSDAQLLEGYGATECSPVIAFNPPGASRLGAVGTILPGMEARLQPVAGIEEGGQLFVRGPNVMRGYLGPAGSSGLSDGWFDTGDLATVDDAGYIRIIGRLKRMARVGAEMISLAAVELHAGALWPEAHHAAIAVESARGGERIVLVTDQVDAGRHAFVQWAKAHGVKLSEAPHRIVVAPTLPLLATGKPDYPAVAALYAATDVRPANKET